jgi:hypothetical protein
MDRRDTEVHQNVFFAFEAGGWQVTGYVTAFWESAPEHSLSCHSCASTLARSRVFGQCETGQAAPVSLNREQSVTEGHALLIVEI